MKWLDRLRDPTTRQWLRRGRRTVWGILLLASVWYAVVRWTTPPAAVTRGADNLKDLVSLINRPPPFVR